MLVSSSCLSLLVHCFGGSWITPDSLVIHSLGLGCPFMASIQLHSDCSWHFVNSAVFSASSSTFYICPPPFPRLSYVDDLPVARSHSGPPGRIMGAQAADLRVPQNQDPQNDVRGMIRTTQCQTGTEWNVDESEPSWFLSRQVHCPVPFRFPFPSHSVPSIPGSTTLAHERLDLGYTQTHNNIPYHRLTFKRGRSC